MVRTKRAASKKQSAQPMDSPPGSPVRQEQYPVVSVEAPVPRQEAGTTAKPGDRAMHEQEEERSTESEKLPLPQVREVNQPAITSFFSKSPKKKPEEKGKIEKEAKRKTVSIDEGKDKEEVQTPKPRHQEGGRIQGTETSKLKPRISTRAPPATSTLEKEKQEVEKVPTPAKKTKSTPAHKRKTTLQHEGTEASPEKQKQEGEKAKLSKKRKSEVEQLDSPQVESRTRKKGSRTDVEAPAPATSQQQQKEEEQPETQAKAIPPRRKQVARKTRAPKTESAEWYPFVSRKAKAAYDDILRGKQPIKERALDLRNADDMLKSIISELGWTRFCAKPDEGALQLVKEFYANLDEMVDNKVFVRGIWVDVSSDQISKAIGSPEFPEDAYSVLLEHGVDKEELEKVLCQSDKEVIWATGKNNKPLNFNTGSLQPQWIPLFKLICCRLIPTTHTSHVTIDRATLLYAMINKTSVDAGWIIHNNIINSIGPSKALWFPAIITKLCVKAGVKIEKNEEKVKAGLAISARTSTEAPGVGGPRPSVGLQDELREIKENQEKILSFLEDQHNWNKSMEEKWNKYMGKNSDLPTFPGDISAGTSQKKMKKKGDAKAPPPPKLRRKVTAKRRKYADNVETEKSEEEIATHLGGGDTSGRFTSVNLSSEEETE